MTFLQVKREHRSIRRDTRAWYEFVEGEFLTPQQAVNCNVDLRKCRIVDVKNVNKMYWCFGALLCDKEDLTVVAENATEFDGQILKYRYSISIDIENELGELSVTKYATFFDSDTPLTSKKWKKLRAIARHISVINETTAWVLITRREREEIVPSGYAAMYCADYSGSYRHEHYFDYTNPGCYYADYSITTDRA